MNYIDFVCFPYSQNENPLKFLYENRDLTKPCHYTLELKHSALCIEESSNTLSVGSILCIVYGAVFSEILYILARRFVQFSNPFQIFHASWRVSHPWHCCTALLPRSSGLAANPQLQLLADARQLLSSMLYPFTVLYI